MFSVVTSSVGTSRRYKLGWSILLTFLVSKSDSVLVGLKVTSHLFDQLVILSRSELILRAAFSGVATISLNHQQIGGCRSVFHKQCRLYRRQKVRGPK